MFILPDLEQKSNGRSREVFGQPRKRTSIEIARHFVCPLRQCCCQYLFNCAFAVSAIQKGEKNPIISPAHPIRSLAFWFGFPVQVPLKKPPTNHQLNLPTHKPTHRAGVRIMPCSALRTLGHSMFIRRMLQQPKPLAFPAIACFHRSLPSWDEHGTPALYRRSDKPPPTLHATWHHHRIIRPAHSKRRSPSLSKETTPFHRQVSMVYFSMLSSQQS